MTEDECKGCIWFEHIIDNFHRIKVPSCCKLKMLYIAFISECKDKEIPEQKQVSHYMDNSEYDYGHNVNHNQNDSEL